MSVPGVGLLGCGVVGSAVVRGLARAAVSDAVALQAVAVRDVDKQRDCVLPEGILTADPWAVVDDPSVAVVVEVIGGLDPAAGLITRALESGKPVVTANKAVLGALGPQLRALASECGVPLLFEAGLAGTRPHAR